MNQLLRDATLGTQIVAYAWAALFVGGLLLMVGGAIVGRLVAKKGRVPNPFEAVFGVGVIVGIPGAFAAAMALLVTPLLVGMPLPLAGWLLIAALSLFGIVIAKGSFSGEMSGCSQMIASSVCAYGLCWAGTAIVMAEPPTGNAGSFLRPLLVAAPVALFVARHSRDRVKQGIAFELFIAVVLAIAFLPVEQGFSAHLLPASDWLRFPIAGAIVFATWPLLAIPLNLIFSSRAIRFDKLPARWPVSRSPGGCSASSGPLRGCCSDHGD